MANYTLYGKKFGDIIEIRFEYRDNLPKIIVQSYSRPGKFTVYDPLSKSHGNLLYKMIKSSEITGELNKRNIYSCEDINFTEYVIPEGFSYEWAL